MERAFGGRLLGCGNRRLGISLVDRAVVRPVLKYKSSIAPSLFKQERSVVLGALAMVSPMTHER